MIVSASDYTGPTDFVHHHAHTYFSVLDGVSSPAQYAKQCVELGYPAMSATEHGHMGSVPEMYFEFKQAKVKYIAGCEIYFNQHEQERAKLGKDYRKLKLTEPDYYERMARNRHLTILAKNATGYTNLVKLTTQAYRTGFYYKPRIWYEKLLEFKEGLIILSGCLNGPVCHELRRTNQDGAPNPHLIGKDKYGAIGAIDWIRRFKADFGDDYYIELQEPGVPGDVAVFHNLVDIADHLKMNCVITNDCHYLKRADYEIQTIMMAIDQGLTVDSPDLWHVNSSEQYMKTRAELWERFHNADYSAGLDNAVFEDACNNTLVIAEKCDSLKFDDTSKIPSYDGADDKLRLLVAKGLAKRGYDKNDRRYVIDGREVTHVEQAAIELERIIDKGFSSYFLITHELISYGLSRGFPFSPRGSAGGSLVCHLLGIIPFNPLQWSLSFDRFLSPSRGGYMLKVQMPPPATPNKA